MTNWIHTTLFLIQGSLLFSLCKGTIECICTTLECKRDLKSSCQANHMCYVQYMPVDGTSGSGPEASPIVRGCIDERTPLLCENRRPQAYTGSWPVLLCCKEEWCNKDVLPTVPPWLTSFENTDEEELHIRPRPQEPSQEDDPESKFSDLGHHDFNFSDDFLPISSSSSNSQTNSLGYNHKQRGQDSSSNSEQNEQQPRRPRSKGRTINPLYVAVPVAGACVLLAIIIFAIYVLKRQNEYYEEYRYESNIRRQLPPHYVTGEYPENKKAMYVACERSSLGSETKLLMKVWPHHQSPQVIVYLIQIVEHNPPFSFKSRLYIQTGVLCLNICSTFGIISMTLIINSFTVKRSRSELKIISSSCHKSSHYLIN